MTRSNNKASKVLACIYKPLGWFPVVIINAIAVWSYFAYVIILCVDNVTDPWEKGIYLAFYHPFFLMFMVCYWQAIMSSPGYTPSQFYLSSEDAEKYENAENPQEVITELAKELPIVTLSVNKTIRFCEPCYLIKPDRSHHCSMCQRCVLKMDHHCPWINNCVGWGNYKYFILFLSYSITYTMYVALTSLKYFIKFWSGNSVKANSNLHVLFLFFVSTMFSISLWSLFGFHIYLTLSNKTTLESFRAPIFQHGPDKKGFYLGRMNNFKQVFGNKKWKWFLPIFSTLGNGYSYRTSFRKHNETTGLLIHNDYDDDDDSQLMSSERDVLLNYEEPTAIYTGAHFVNSADIKLNGYLGKGRSLSDDDDEEEDVAFDASELHRTRHVSLDMQDLISSGDEKAG
ncbi:palmitoyltransferase ZDHHC15B-like isoform X1 [Hydractinia symbiolongicarpus]|uniref:palmitoyltransferase ZDHHC15B-like isoform X1 n=1 Tax=Hydractinia symbiolongicarpus TaxID=13093 RepID=UPI00254CC995|nr:palmitoyltransferase ZDHHC15B-like isoform X1 [Hydractinia symbiolongicarpus]